MRPGRCHRRQTAPLHRRRIHRKACATAARSISTASASPMSPPIRRSATASARSRGCTTRCTTRKRHDLLTCPTDTGSGGYTHRFFRVPRSREDLRGAQAAIAEWARLSYGWMGRTPDYKAAYTNTLGGNAEYYGPYADNARAWYKRAQEAVPFMNHAIVNPPIDRHKPAEQVKDVFVCGGEGDRRRHHRLGRQGGRHLGGDHALQLHGPELEDGDRGPGHVADVHGADRRARAEADLPHLLRARGAAQRLAVRLPAVLALRRERRDLHPRQGVRPLGGRVHLPRSGARAELLSALRLHAAASSSRAARASRSSWISSAACWPRRCAAPAATRRAATRCCWARRSPGATCSGRCPTRWRNNPHPWNGDAVLPDLQAGQAYRVFAPDAYPRIKDIVERTVTSALIYLPSSVKDFANPAIEPLSAPLCPRLARHRLRRADQDHEAAVGRHRHRVRRPARAV